MSIKMSQDAALPINSPPRRRFQFSLQTALLAACLAASAMLVYLRREPWYASAPIPRHEFKFEVPPAWWNSNEENGAWIAPDRLRQFHPFFEELDCYICDRRIEDYHAQRLCTLGSLPISTGGFLDNATFLAGHGPWPQDVDPQNNDVYVVWHRRFPEWWWGHFYRPEVWITIVLSGVLLLRIFASISKRRTQG